MSEIDELIAHLETQKTTPTVDRLISRVTEQDREIERLRKWEKTSCKYMNKKNKQIEKAEVEIERLREYEELIGGGGDALVEDRDYQRRHRKWALERARTNLEFYNLTYEHAQQFKSRAEKAEAELKQRREENLMLRDGIEIGRKVSVSNLCHAEKAEARVKELEAEKEKV